MKKSMKAKSAEAMGIAELYEALLATEEKANQGLRDFGTAVEVLLDAPTGTFTVSHNGSVEFSMKVDDEKALESLKPLNGAIWRVANSVAASAKAASAKKAEEQRAEETAESAIVSAMDATACCPTYAKPRRQRGEVDTAKSLREAMVGLVNDINDAASRENVPEVFSYVIDNGSCLVKAGDDICASAWVSGDIDAQMSTERTMVGAFSKLRAMSWRRFDALKHAQWTKEGRPINKKHGFSGARYARRDDTARLAKTARRTPVDALSPVPAPTPATSAVVAKPTLEERLKEIVDAANAEMSAWKGELTVSSDDIGIYVYAGKIPVASAPKGIGEEKAFEVISKRIRSFVDSARGAYERRLKNGERIAELEYNSACDKAMAARFGYKPEEAKAEEVKEEAKAEEVKEEAKAEEVKEEAKAEEVKEEKDWLWGPNPEVAKAIVSEMKKIVRSFNQKTRMRFAPLKGVVDETDLTMTIRGFTRGVVAMCGSEPCYITMFPLVGNNSTAEEMLAHLSAGMKALCENRIARFESIRAEMERVDQLHSISSRREALKAAEQALDKELEAMAM